MISERILYPVGMVAGAGAGVVGAWLFFQYPEVCRRMLEDWFALAVVLLALVAIPLPELIREEGDD